MEPQPPPPQYAPAAAPAAARPTNSLAVVSLGLGVASYVVVPFIGGIAAIVTGHMARAQIRRTGEGGKGFATAGLVLGYVHMLLFLIVVALIVAFFGFLISHGTPTTSAL